MSALYPPACESSATPVVQGVPVQVASVTDSPAANTSAQEAMGKLNNFPPGLVKAMVSSLSAFPVRFFVVDNSGSMQATDGNRLILDAQGRGRMVQATRWEELSDTVMQIGTMAHALNARVDFHLLNPRPVLHGRGRLEPAGQFFTMTHDGRSTEEVGAVSTCGQPLDVLGLRQVMATSPGGTTPLTEAVMQLVSLIEPAAAQLRARGQQAVVVLATDGMPNDPPSFLAALQRLQLLPVWTVVRLCTDDDGVVRYWSDLDASLEAPLEVLDDDRGEAKEVHAKNPWLTYGSPLQLARTFGLQDKLFDLLDEAALLPSQVRQFCELLLGVPLPEPDLDAAAFIAAVQAALQTMPPVFDPLTSRLKPWIDVHLLTRQLDRHNGVARCFGPNCVIS